MNTTTLYKKDTKGNLREWSMIVDGDKYWTVSGLVNGEKVTSAPTKAKPKNVGRSNATTAEKQAAFEANAEVTKKMEQGGYFADINDVDEETYFKPMLAATYGDIKNFNPVGVYSQPKLDGIRCVVTKKGMFTRNGKEIVSCPHIQESLKALFGLFPDVVLDGELYNHDLRDNFNEITSLFKKQNVTEASLKETEKVVEYHIYDAFFPNNPSLSFEKRSVTIREAIFDFAPNDKIVPVWTQKISSREQLDKTYSDYMENGFEGQMIRIADSPYENKRTNNLIKRKEFEDREFPIRDIVEGEGNWAGYAKSVVVVLEDGTLCSSGIRGNQGFLCTLLEEKNEYVDGAGTATVRYQNRTPDGKLRFPVVTAIWKGKRDL